MKKSHDQAPDNNAHEIACQQVLTGDASVFSIQWVRLPGSTHGITPDLLLQLYLDHVRRFTATIVRPSRTDNGIEFRLFATSIPLISFAAPERGTTPRGERVTLPINGGILVQPRQCDRGKLDFLVEQTPGGLKLTLLLSDYCPLLLGPSTPSRWRKWLYRLTQAYIHKVVTVRFLARIYRQLSGYGGEVRVVKVTLQPGEET